MKHAIYGIVRAQGNIGTSYISAAYSIANKMSIKVWGHILQCMFEECAKDNFTRPRSAVGNVYGNRCESACRSRGREFDPSQVPYFRGD